MQRLPNYLRKHRKAAGMSQDDVAFLLGCGSSAQVCRHERFSRQPSLLAACAYEIIFGTPVRDLFSGLFEQVGRKLASRAMVLSQKRDGTCQEAPQSKVTRSARAAQGRHTGTPSPP